jgi:ribosomal protein L7/L12
MKLSKVTSLFAAAFPKHTEVFKSVRSERELVIVLRAAGIVAVDKEAVRPAGEAEAYKVFFVSSNPNNKILTIKAVREVTRLSLIEAKVAVETATAVNPFEFPLPVHKDEKAHVERLFAEVGAKIYFEPHYNS